MFSSESGDQLKWRLVCRRTLFAGLTVNGEESREQDERCKLQVHLHCVAETQLPTGPETGVTGPETRVGEE